MLIKAADDKQPQIAALEALLVRPDADAGQRRRIEAEIRQIRAGVAGERDAAYEIEFLLGANRNRMSIHDLRIEVGDRVAQIDHLVVNRLLDVWVCESKHFSEGVSVNAHGEWTAYYGGRSYGIPSPVEQNRRHVAVLSDAFERGLVKLPKRLGITIRPKLYSLVLVSNGAKITRPRGRAAAAVQGLETVVKVEQFAATVGKAWDERGVAALGKVVGQETVEALARQLAALHRPVDVNWAARFGLSAVPPLSAPAAVARQASGRPVCASCGRGVSDAVIAYCEAHGARFGGAVYCMACQAGAGGASPNAPDARRGDGMGGPR